MATYVTRRMVLRTNAPRLCHSFPQPPSRSSNEGLFCGPGMSLEGQRNGIVDTAESVQENGADSKEVERFTSCNAVQGDDGHDLLTCWRAFGRSSEFPFLVRKLMHQVQSLELELGKKLVFGGPQGKLQGPARDVEERKHRAAYRQLSGNEEKLQFFSARQVACRILGSKGYLCRNCWLPLGNCICKRIEAVSLLPGIRLWLYMHPKDFLRKNNSGKLLWQVFGEESARLCIFGIEEQENAMWDAFKKAGQTLVWILYPEGTMVNYRVDELTIPNDIVGITQSMEKCKSILNFVLMDGTWSNSKAMVNRLKDRATLTWEQQDIQSLSLSPENPSVLHGLRPQPSLDRTCTAAAAAQLLRELELRKEFSKCALGKAADALDHALNQLLGALITRRRKVGRLVSPMQALNSDNDCCE